MLSETVSYRAVKSRDARFDGMIYVGVTSTGIYCRPSCPAMTPKPEHMRFYPTAAAAQQAGFRACKRCRPDAVPGSPEWNVRNDVAGRAMRLIADGIVDREGVPGLARKVGYSSRQLQRSLVAEVGAGPLALARAQRTQIARTLLETTTLPVTDVAFAAGFSSVRQFNETIQAVFSQTPSDLRRRIQPKGATSEAGVIHLRLPYRPPMDFGSLLSFLSSRAIPGVEEVADGAYRRVLRLAHGLGVAAIRPGPEGQPPHVVCDLQLDDLRDLASAIARLRRLFDLDADPAAILEPLRPDPTLGPLVRQAPGLRAPGHVDPFELAIRYSASRYLSPGRAPSPAASRSAGERHSQNPGGT
jgi:AraC family transcriptional regulator of adaptative response / DNA-3-methyladenine glycosylase II